MEKFNNVNVYISCNSFKQNIKIKNELRLFVANNITYPSITAIGGESYLYGLTDSNVTTMNCYTNSFSIYEDVKLNSDNQSSCKVTNNLVNYNDLSDITCNEILLINLSNLNVNILNIVNKQYYNKIIIINCHHENFWKRIGLLYNYKLEVRRKFITSKYFVTVNILKLKHVFVPFGTSCAAAYNLKKLNLRKCAFPFDWCKITITQLLSVFKNKFINYENLSIKKYSDSHSSYILSNCYNIMFAHEVLMIDDIEHFQDKLQVRIARLLEFKHTPLVFLHINFGKKTRDLSKLTLELNKYFSHYEIFYISDISPNISNKVIFYKLTNYEFIDWQFSNLNWRALLNYFLSHSSLFRPVVSNQRSM